MNQVGNMPEIRRAVADDAPAITRIIRAAFPEYTPDVIPDVIPTHTTFVAVSGETVVGFVDCFTTYNIDDEPRWEIDWLAVDPKRHGHGIGTALVRAARDAGKESGAKLARGLVRLSNAASERAFEKNDFIRLSDVLALYTSDQPLKSIRSVADTRRSLLIPVTRLHDIVVWIEGELSDRVLQQARHLIGVRGWHAAGALVPRSEKKELKLLEAEGYKHRANYQWYIYRYT